MECCLFNPPLPLTYSAALMWQAHHLTWVWGLLSAYLSTVSWPTVQRSGCAASILSRLAPLHSAALLARQDWWSSEEIKQQRTYWP